MDPISKLAKTFGAIRRAASERRAGGDSDKFSNTSPPSSTAGKPQTQSLEVEVVRRLKAIGGNADRRDESVRVVIEQMLLHEFGDQPLSSEHLAHTVSKVQRVMDADPGIRAELDRLIEELIK